MKRKMNHRIFLKHNGAKAWVLDYSSGPKYHRVDGPAIEFADGNRHWYIHGKRHRIDGPAVEMLDGTKEWWIHGKLHREDGPAIEYGNGQKEWWLHDVPYSFDIWIKNVEITIEEKALLMLRYK